MAKLNKQAVKKTGRERKEIMVAELTKRIDETTGLVFTDYKGLTHQQLETLKRELKKDDATMIVAKNSLMRLSLSNSKDYKDAKDNEALTGSMATLFIKGDMVEPLKKLQKAAKEAGLPKVKFGVLEGQILDETAILKIASLPGRETLLTQLAAMLNSPIQGFVTGLNAIPQKFVMTLDAIASAKQNSQPAQQPEPTQAPAEETKTEETKKDPETAAPSDEASEEKTEETPTEDAPKDEAVIEAQSDNPADSNKEKTEEFTKQTKDETETTKEKESATQTEKEEGGEK